MGACNSENRRSNNNTSVSIIGDVARKKEHKGQIMIGLLLISKLQCFT